MAWATVVGVVIDRVDSGAEGAGRAQISRAAAIGVVGLDVASELGRVIVVSR